MLRYFLYIYVKNNYDQYCAKFIYEVSQMPDAAIDTLNWN
jgi:hypothetical protein